MKKRQHKFPGARLTAAALALLLTAQLTGCGGGSDSKYASGAAQDTAAAPELAAGSAAYDGGIYEYAEMEEDAGGVSDATVQTNRKLIRNVDMSVETREFDTLLANVKSRVEALGGYIEQSDVYNGSYTSDYRSRSASLKVRIPADRLDGFLDELEDQSNVLRKNESVEDVTLQYVDLESHKKALLAEQEGLLSMLESAQSIEDIIAINEKLTDVRYQLESMESQLRTYDNQIDYSTVYLDVEEVERYEPVAKKGAWERIREGFLDNVRRVTSGISEFCINFVIALPILITAAVVIGLMIVLIWLLVRASEKRTQKKRAKLEAQGVTFNRYGSRVNQTAQPPSQEKGKDQ